MRAVTPRLTDRCLDTIGAIDTLKGKVSGLYDGSKNKIQ
jgi:hypothetical protein